MTSSPTSFVHQVPISERACTYAPASDSTWPKMSDQLVAPPELSLAESFNIYSVAPRWRNHPVLESIWHSSEILNSSLLITAPYSLPYCEDLTQQSLTLFLPQQESDLFILPIDLKTGSLVGSCPIHFHICMHVKKIRSCHSLCFTSVTLCCCHWGHQSSTPCDSPRCPLGTVMMWWFHTVSVKVGR